MKFKPLFLAALLAFGGMAFAQDEDEDAAPPGGDAAKKQDDPKKKGEEYDKFVKDLSKTEGAFTIYRKGKQLFVELPEDKVGKLFLAQLTWSSGAGADLQGGDPLGGATAVSPFRLERHEEKVWLVQPNLKYRWSKDDPLALASERGFPQAVLGSYAITQSSPEKKLLLVDMTSFFMGTPFQVSQAVAAGLGGAYMLDSDKSGPLKVKGFPENTVVQMGLYYTSSGGPSEGGDSLAELLGLSSGPPLQDKRSAPLKLTYNVWYRKDSDYQPRVSDQRVGYFTEDFYSVDKFYKADRTERYINRWNLKKKYPEAALSEPVKPIVWVLDPSIPPKYRPAVRKGVLMWNKAFEAIGFKDAVRVEDAPSDPDYDHADGRYNVIRFTMTEDAGYAVALFRTDPFTGEMLNASVTIDANMASFGYVEVSDITGPARKSLSRALDVFTRPANPRSDDRWLWGSAREQAEEQYDAAMRKQGWQVHRCAYAEGKAASAAFAAETMAAYGRAINQDDYVQKMLADTVSHEVGHCMGLRHNFVSSTNLTVDQLANDAVTDQQGISASVMDYTPANLAAVIKGGSNFYASTVGPYDMWAIRYGYESSRDERSFLARVAGMSTKPGLAYMTDEDADAFNPYVVRWDGSRDPVEFSRLSLEAARRIRAYAVKMNVEAEGPEHRSKLLMSSISRVFREGRMCARFLGGTRSTRDFSGATLTSVPPEVQREAMRLLSQYCLSDKSFDLPPALLNSLSRNMNEEAGSTWTAPLRDYIATNQSMLVARAMGALVADGIAENEYKLGKNAYTMEEHYNTLCGAVFSEVGTGKTISPLRRDLQRFALDGLIRQSGAGVGAVNDDARYMARQWLIKINARAQKTAPDGMTQAHLMGLRDAIGRHLTRVATGG